MVASSSLAKHVASRRKELGLGQSEAARLADVSRPTWAGWEKGVMPYDRNWVAIERVLEWKRGSIEAILDGADPAPVRDHSAPSVPPIPDGVLIDPADWAVMTPSERATYVKLVTGVRRRRQQAARGG